MIRTLIGILAGYLFMTTVVTLTLLPAILLIDPDRLCDPETRVMTNWFILVVEWPVSLFSAVIGGVIAALAAGRAGRKTAIQGLQVFVLLIGTVGGFGEVIGRWTEDPTLEVESELAGNSVEETEAVVGEVAVEKDAEAAEETLSPPIQPVWDLVALPLLGALGVLLGGRMVSRAAVGLGLEPPVDSDG